MVSSRVCHEEAGSLHLGASMKKVLFATTSLVAFAVAGMANAADLGRPVYKAPPPAPPPVQDWSGIYVGLEGGYGWGKQRHQSGLRSLLAHRRSAAS